MQPIHFGVTPPRTPTSSHPPNNRSLSEELLVAGFIPYNNPNPLSTTASRHSTNSRQDELELAGSLQRQDTSQSIREKALKMRNKDAIEKEKHGGQTRQIKHDITMNAFRASTNKAEYEKYIVPLKQERASKLQKKDSLLGKLLRPFKK